MSNLYEMNSNQMFGLTCPYIAVVLPDPYLKASMGFPYVRQTTRTFQHVNNIGGHVDNQAFDIKSLSCAGVGKSVTFVSEAALSTLATLVITL